MKIKEIYVEARKSKNYQTYVCGLKATIDNEDVNICIEKLQKQARKQVLKEIGKDNKQNENPYIK